MISCKIFSFRPDPVDIFTGSYVAGWRTLVSGDNSARGVCTLQGSGNVNDMGSDGCLGVLDVC
jgi:hypothetical protein